MPRTRNRAVLTLTCLSGIILPKVFICNSLKGRTMGESSRSRLRKIHINLPEEVHKKLRVKAALEDVSIQAFVARVVAEAVETVRLSEVERAKRRKSS